MNAKHLGSDFDDFLRKEDMLDEAEAVGLKRVLAHQVRHLKNQGGRAKTAMARRLGAGHPAQCRPPTHPGEILREDLLPALNLSVAEAARQLRVSRQTLHRVLSGRSGVSAEMAVRLGKFCGNGPGLWLRMQQAYDLWHAEQRLRQELEKIPGHPVE